MANSLLALWFLNFQAALLKIKLNIKSCLLPRKQLQFLKFVPKASSEFLFAFFLFHWLKISNDHLLLDSGNICLNLDVLGGLWRNFQDHRQLCFGSILEVTGGFVYAATSSLKRALKSFSLAKCCYPEATVSVWSKIN